MVNWQAKRIKSGSKLVRQGLATYAAPTPGNVALLAYRGVKALRAIVNSEEHELDTSLNHTLTGSTPVITCLNAIDQGDYASQRTGHSSLMTNLTISEAYLTGTNSIFREIIFIDKQQISDTNPVVSDILETPSDVQSLYNKLTKGRFQVLSDRMWAQSYLTAPFKLRKYHKKLQKHVHFNGTAGTDLQKNGVYRIILCSSAATIYGKARLGFHDN